MSHHTESEVSIHPRDDAQASPVSVPRSTKKKLTRADSPPPDPGIVRDLTPADLASQAYVGPDVNIMFYGERTFQKIMNGEKVIIVPVPGKKWDPEATARKMRERFPEWSGLSKASIRRIQREMRR